MKNILILVLVCMYANANSTIIRLPELGITCEFSKCNLGRGNKSCMLIDSVGGAITIDGINGDESCNMFLNKKIIWENERKGYNAKVIKVKNNSW